MNLEPVITLILRNTSWRTSKSVYLRAIIQPGDDESEGSTWIM